MPMLSTGEALRVQRQRKVHGKQEQSLGAILSNSRSKTDGETFPSDPEGIV